MASKHRKNSRFFRRTGQQDSGDQPVSPKSKKRRIEINRMKKGIFILPSLLTLSSIFLSFYSIISTIKGDFVLAAALIIAAAFFDGIDGKVARLTKTTTRFGLELDSLADAISFGVAPALLMYLWALNPLARIGWVSAFVFVSCGVLRLARFNVQSGNIDPKRFNGLPVPAAAAMVSTTVLFFHKLQLNPADAQLALLIFTYVLSFLMVSSIKFHAFKNLSPERHKAFGVTVAFVLLLALVAASPFVVPFFLCAAYVLSGPLLTLWTQLRKQKDVPEQDSEMEEADVEATP